MAERTSKFSGSTTPVRVQGRERLQDELDRAPSRPGRLLATLSSSATRAPASTRSAFSSRRSATRTWRLYRLVVALLTETRDPYFFFGGGLSITVANAPSRDRDYLNTTLKLLGRECRLKNKENEGDKPKQKQKQATDSPSLDTSERGRSQLENTREIKEF